MAEKSSNVVWHQAAITRQQRERRHGHKAFVLWFTGLSASGKSTLSHAVEKELYGLGCNTYVLDGDNVRHGLCSDLGFSLEDRQENLRRVGEAAKLLLDAGVITLTAFISPLRQERERVRSLFPHGEFIEVFCDASLEICESRDPKQLYRRARAGEIADFTGISSPYEAPVNPELRCDTGNGLLQESVQQVMELLRARGLVDFP